MAVAKKTRCASCRKAIERKRNTCFGCGRVVCVSCVNEYDHMGFGGLHGLRQRRKKKA